MMNQHVVLMGDSIFDNAAYVPGAPAVADHLCLDLATGWRVTLVARDGDMLQHLTEQFTLLPEAMTHLVISIGGNDALDAIDALTTPTETVRSALSFLTGIRTAFQREYRAMLWQALALRRPLAVCTIYDAVPGLAPELQTALCLFNDTIVREAAMVGVPVIDLRALCTAPEDYSAISPIEPSAQGGQKIAAAIADWLRAQPTD